MVLTQFELLQFKNCPPEKRAASTKPIVPMRCGFVVASASHALRDGEGMLYRKASHCPTRAARCVSKQSGVYCDAAGNAQLNIQLGGMLK